MLIYDNRIYRDATPEEIEMLENLPAPVPDDDAGEEDFIQVLDDLGVRL